MKAAVVGENGLEIREIDTPKPGPAEVLIKVRACGLNRADVTELHAQVSRGASRVHERAVHPEVRESDHELAVPTLHIGGPARGDESGRVDAGKTAVGSEPERLVGGIGLAPVRADHVPEGAGDGEVVGEVQGGREVTLVEGGVTLFPQELASIP